MATTLVGNNVANYLTTLAIGFATLAVFEEHAEWMEIIGTLLMSPIVFIGGELLPKNLYYRAPLLLLRRDAGRLVVFYYLFLVVSFPLIGISKIFEKLGKAQDEQSGLVLGRSRLVQVLSQGHREGILTDVQTRLIRGVMNVAGQSVRSSTTPSDRVLGVEEVLRGRRFWTSPGGMGFPSCPCEKPMTRTAGSAMSAWWIWRCPGSRWLR